ncbi:PREDICTED: zinc finger CCCH domain-containing protein 38-like [Camelina sativa]|uniref:Zinc finger CCCH domain-containing protein 38-like n=1 Tax=Camelina sativa TaxID=90675 RepID=A0ABM0W5I9_CAMSA|nr:PREDICTED: zinc finger CCCH domain-containing protein 38-like [Camelina sativa]
MSGLERTCVSKRGSKEETHHHHPSLNANSSSYNHDKESEFNAESNGCRRSDDHHPGEARTRSRVSHNNENSYYSEQDDTRQQFFPRSGSRSNSRSRSRSRSPIYRARRDAGSYDRQHKTRTLVSPTPIREFNKRGSGHQFDQSNGYGWEYNTRKPRESKYHTDDFRGKAMMKGSRSFEYDTEFPEDYSRNGFSDSRLRRHRSGYTGEKETQRRDGDGGREFHRSYNIPCKFLAAGFCRNGKYCRFSHDGADRKQLQDNNFYRQDRNYHSGGHNKWNDVERLDDRRLGGMEVSRASKGVTESKGNGSWIDDMEMSPDWNYGVQSLKNPVKEEHGVVIIGQSSQSRVQSNGMFPHGDKTVVEKPIAASHQSHVHPVNVTPVQGFSQNHNVLPPYLSSPTPGGSQQVLATAAIDLSVGSNLSNLESGKVNQNNHQSTVEKSVLVQNTVSKEQLDKITNISASIAQFLANRQPIPQLNQALQMPPYSESSMAVQPNQATTTAVHTQSNVMSSNPTQLMSTGAEGVPAVTALQVSNVDGIQDLTLNPKGCEEKGSKKTDEASKEEEEGKKTGEDTNDAENIVDEDVNDDGEGSDEENKKGKDPKEMLAFKFALVEVVKELLKPAWKEGKMDKDVYKNIVKKVVEKVTVTMQSGNVPQTQEKIDQYLSASKPKLTKLVQAYISKIKKT